MKAPLHINWNISYRCPLNCAHCYSRVRVTMPELDLAGKLAVADNIVASGVLSVNLGGGEPTVCPDVPAVIERLANSNVLVEIATSGWGSTRAQVRELASRGLSSVYLSIDDVRPEHHDAIRGRAGCLEAAKRAAKWYRDAGVGVICSTVVTRDNFPVLGDVVALAEELGCNGIELKRLRLQGNARSRHDLELESGQVDELYEHVASWKREYPLDIICIYGAKRVPGIDEGCPCGRTVLAIMSDGTIAPCVYNPRAIGNATRDSISRLWNESPELARMRASEGCVALQGAFDDFL